jgi:hypothetical protein
MQKPFLLLSSLVFLLSAFTTCSSPTESNGNNDADTTSHNFTFTIHKIGPSGSFLNDIFVVNENDIWAVGIVYDTLPNGLADTQKFYNVVHWNGTIWEKIKLKQRFVGETGLSYHLDGAEIESVWVTPEGTVWVAVGAISYLKSGVWHEVELTYEQQIGTRKIWGSSDRNLYFVGLNGGILYYNGSSYTRLPKLTDQHFTDIWGDGNEVLVMAQKYAQNYYAPIYSLKSNQLIEFPNQKEFESNSQTGIWFVGNDKFLAGSGLFTFDYKLTKWKTKFGLPSGFYPYKVAGNALNDYWVCDDFGNIGHFNGSNWREYNTAKTQLKLPSCYNVSVNDNVVGFLVFDNNRDYILIGKRN